MVQLSESTKTEGKLRWFQLSPKRLLILLTAIEIGLIIFQPLFPKGLPVLAAIVFVCITVLLFFCGYMLALWFRWRFQFSLRSLFLLTINVAIACSWLTVEMQQARKQQDFVRKLRKSGGGVSYSSGVESSMLAKTLGVDFFGDLVGVAIYYGQNEISHQDLEFVRGLPSVQYLNFGLSNFTDADLKCLKGISNHRHSRWYEEGP